MTELDDFRSAKDAYFRESPESPLTDEQKRTFVGLRYYPEDPSLRVTGQPELFAEQEVFDMQTSTGEDARYVRWATFEFAVGQAQASLILFRDPGSGSFFLPFQDAGRGDETYGAGRYVEPELLEDGGIVVDFNYAYNPYCAYNDAWSCPLPPPENRLNVHIRAGEMDFPHDG